VSRLKALFALVVMALSLGAATPLRAQALVADLSNHLVAITSGFNGADILLFGAVEGQGDVIVTVRGPAGDQSVRRKVRVAGLWINGPEVAFRNVPEFYAVFSSRPLAEILNPDLADLQEIGVDHLSLRTDDERNPLEIDAFRAALTRAKQREGLYPPEGKLLFLGARLFRANLVFPGNVPTGSYTVQVLLIRNGNIVNAQTTPLYISQSGVSADVHEFAHRQPWLYGIFAIVAALAIGWLSGVIFKKV
jgi:uncharacterized protein (TIGR02186 family)